MVKISQLILPVFLAFGSSSAFSPLSQTTFGVRSNPLRLSEEAAPEATPEATPGGKIVPVKEETVQFTAGILGGVAGLTIGGPVIGLVGAAVANFASKNDNEASEVISAVSKSSIEVYNYLVKLDTKYEVLVKAQSSLESALDKVKDNESVPEDTVKQVEDALASTSAKIKEINDEYDLVGAGVTALGVVGDLLEKAVVKAVELNDEYKLSDKALESIKKAVDTAQQSASSVASGLADDE